jgi:hypothetical protein
MSMLTSINPLGERIRGNRWLFTVMWLTLGGIVGGAVLGAVAGGIGVVALGGLTPSSRLMVLVVALVVAAVWDLLDRRFPGRRQVDENWLTKYRSWVYGFGFGAQLGVGVATVVNTALVPVLLVAAALVDDIVVATMIGVVFGATRGFTMLLSATVHSPDELRDLHRRLDEFDVRVRMAGALSSLSLGVVAVVVLGV